MGIQATHMYFKSGIPKIKTIRNKFFEVTGLELRLKYKKQLVELQKEEEIIPKGIIGENSNLSYIEFYVESFYSVHMEYSDSNSFELECGLKGRYFYMALQKTFFELGGKKVDREYGMDLCDADDSSGIDINNYLLPYDKDDNYWADIKKWNDYNISDRPEK